jgi:ubiquinone/menaquinone biosynthesis C-methylase UbiE
MLRTGKTFLGLSLATLLLAPVASAADGAPPKHDHYEHDFSDIPKYVKAFEGPQRDAWQKPAEVVALLQLWPGNTVADVGAGTGYFEPLLSKAVGPTGRVLALDSEPKMVSYLQHRAEKEGLANVTAQKVPPHDPALPEGSVDRILIVDTWHHVPDRVKYSAALNRALRPGGFVAIVDFTAESPEGPPPRHRLTPESVIAELQAAGFSANTVGESLPHQYVVIGLKQSSAKGKPASTARQRELAKVIDRNAGDAHLSRGVNTGTTSALQKALQPGDDPELRALLYDADTIVVRAVASVLAARGDAGLAVLREVSADRALSDQNRRVVDDEVWNANLRQRQRK